MFCARPRPEGGLNREFVVFADPEQVGDDTADAGEAVHLLDDIAHAAEQAFGFALKIREQTQTNFGAAFFVAQILQLGVELPPAAWASSRSRMRSSSCLWASATAASAFSTVVRAVASVRARQ